MKKTSKLITSALLTVITAFGMFFVPIYAANGQGVGQGRQDTVNANDYSTNNWDRFSYNYGFTSGPNTQSTFGSPTQTDQQGSNPLQDNIRRNKDAAYFPPSYGVFSGEIPTDPSSLFHTANAVTSTANTTNYGTASVNYYGDIETTGLLTSTSLLQSAGNPEMTGNFTVTQTTANSTVGSNLLTQPTYYDDGSIGYLSISAINTYVKVYEGETLANMKLGAAHFEYTSAWDGNIGVAGHNRGAHDYFKGVKDLKIGDLITYETLYGTRIYKVYLKEQISDTDFSYLGWSSSNEISLITCVIDRPTLRWIVKASEVR